MTSPSVASAILELLSRHGVTRAFGVPGLGLALVFALSERDWNVIQNLVLLYGVIFTTINLLVDISYGWLDPRIRY